MSWLRVEAFILSFELSYSPRRWFNCWGGLFTQRAGLYVSMQIVLALLTTTLGSLPPRQGGLRVVVAALVTILSWGIIGDCVLGNTSVAFISRRPTNSMRTLVFALGSYIAFILAFGACYAVSGDRFTVGVANGVSLSALQAIYYSFVTATTLGYGDIRPSVDAAMPQLLVMAELVLGLFYVACIVAQLTSWSRGEPAEAVMLEQLLVGNQSDKQAESKSR